MTVNVGRTAFLPPDRGGRQHLKIMQLLAAVEADGSAPLVETLIATVGRLRRGMTAVIITPSLDPAWVRPLAALRDARGRLRRRDPRRGGVREVHRGGPGRGRPARPLTADAEADELAAKRDARPAPRARRVRAALLLDHPGPGARRGPRPMKRAAPARTGRGLADARPACSCMCLTLAWAIDDARWVLGRPEYLDLLVLAAVGGVLVGFIGPKVGWGRWLTFLIGAIFAALLVPLLTALVVYPDRRVDRGALPDDRRRQRSRPTSTSPSVDLSSTTAVPALHPRPGDGRLGDLDVRVVCRVRASPAAQRGGRRRRDPGREHVAHLHRPAALPGRCSASPRCCC